MELLNYLLTVDLAQFNNSKEFLNYLKNNYSVNEKTNQKIIIDNNDIIVKIGISNTLRDTILFEKMIFEEANARHLDIFFTELKKEGTFQTYTKHGIYTQKKLEINTITIEEVIDFWIKKYGIKKVIYLFNFLKEFKIWDIKTDNIGYNSDFQNYQIFDYQPRVGDIEYFNKCETYLLSKIDNL